MVRRLSDGEQLVAKVNRDLVEKEMLELVHSKQPPSDFIIPLVGLIFSNIGVGILLPLRRSLLALFQNAQENRHLFLQLAGDLLKAIGFLHKHLVAHRDIKPDNLVCTDSSRLQVIDFETAIEVKDADALETELVGTTEFRAPEVGTRHRPRAHSPIKADRYSCGMTLSRILWYSEDNDKPAFQALDDLAHQLMNDYPSDRPDLTVWHEESHQKKREVMELGPDASRKKPRVDSVEGQDSYTQPTKLIADRFIPVH